MTVIAWDGKTLAADKQATNNGLKRKVTKIRKIRGHLCFGAGDFDVLNHLYDWFEQGASPANWPDIQKDKDAYGTLTIITPDNRIMRYERTPYPFEIEETFIAVGSGRDYAMAAMQLGYGAVKAVETAMALDNTCGLGIDVLELG